MTATIRRARAGDADALTRLMHASSAYAGRYGAILDGYAVTPGQIAHDLLFVAESNGRVEGFYSLALGDEPELDLMFVTDRTQGSGLGRALFDHMAATAASQGVAAVKIISHPPSVGFYERMGARIVGRLPPSARVAWERPILNLHIEATDSEGF